jgi:hypothetical protein
LGIPHREVWGSKNRPHREVWESVGPSGKFGDPKPAGEFQNTFAMAVVRHPLVLGDLKILRLDHGGYFALAMRQKGRWLPMPMEPAECSADQSGDAHPPLSGKSKRSSTEAPLRPWPGAAR